MFKLRCTSDAHPRWNRGQPPQSTAGVAGASWIQTIARPESSRWIGAPGRRSDMARKSTGAESSALTTQRRVMSASSGLASSARAPARGSRAMPQVGQTPGPLLTICWCMGQTYSTEAGAGVGAGGSRGKPDFGQGAGPPRRVPGVMRPVESTTPRLAGFSWGGAVGGFRWGRRLELGGHVRGGIRSESLQAVAAANRIQAPAVLEGERIVARLDGHPTDGVDRAARGLAPMSGMLHVRLRSPG